MFICQGYDAFSQLYKQNNNTYIERDVYSCPGFLMFCILPYGFMVSYEARALVSRRFIHG